MRRLKAGNLKGEVGHPKYLPGMTRDQYYNRNMKIYETNTCFHIRDIILEPTDIDSGYDGDKVVMIKGWIKPSGPKGDALKKDLDNPDVNVNFSIRSFTKNEVISGVTVKRIAQVVVWDWVTEPGIPYATKWKSLGIESIDRFDMSIEDLSDNHGGINKCLECSLESEDIKVMTKLLIDSMAKLNSNERNTILDW
jgi:hypothetical protein